MSKYKLIALASFFIAIGIPFQNCQQVKFQKIEDASVSGLNYCEQNQADPACSAPVILKCSFNGTEILEGQSITAFLESGVPYTEECKSESRLCKSGVLSGNYQFSNCQKDAPKNCTFAGNEVKHGEKVPAYLNSSEKYGDTCKSEERVCTNGALSNSYKYSSCKVDAPADCLSPDGHQIKHGDFIKGYKDASVPYGQVCIDQDRQCLNGSFTGNYINPSCSPGAPALCTFGGVSVAHQGTITGWKDANVPYNGTCESETKLCNNGQLSGQFTNSSCTKAIEKSCSLNGITYSPGERPVFYENETVPVGQSCLSQERLCTDGVLSGTYDKKTCVVDTALTLAINVTQTNTYTPFKLLLIIDDSYTMTQSQAQISRNIDSLLAPLRGQSVDIKIITTSDQLTSTYVSELFKGDGTSSKVSARMSSSSTYYRDSTNIRINQVLSYTPMPNSYGISLLSTDSSTVLQTKIQTLKNNILSIGTSGSDTEKVLCPLLRELESESVANRFFNTNDKVAVVVLTDENDNSTSANCMVNKATTNYGPLTVTTNTIPAQPESHYYTFSLSSVTTTSTITASYTYDEYYPAEIRDGITISPGGYTTLSGNYSYVVTSAADIAAAADITGCKALVTNRLMGYSSLNITSCSLSTSTSTTTQGSHTTSDAQDITKNLCNLGKAVSLGNLAFNENWPNYLGNCTQYVTPAVPESTGTPRYIRSSTYNSTSTAFTGLTPSSTTSAFDTKVFNSLETMFGANYFVSFIMKKTGGCALQPGQSYGTRYEQFATKATGKIKTYSICDASFEPALSQVSNFITQVMTTKYTLTLSSTAKVLDVYLNGIKLDPSKYSIVSNVLEMKITLNSGDKIDVKYAPR